MWKKLYAAIAPCLHPVCELSVHGYICTLHACVHVYFYTLGKFPPCSAQDLGNWYWCAIHQWSHSTESHVIQRPDQGKTMKPLKAGPMSTWSSRHWQKQSDHWPRARILLVTVPLIQQNRCLYNAQHPITKTPIRSENVWASIIEKMEGNHWWPSATGLGHSHTW